MLVTFVAFESMAVATAMPTRGRPSSTGSPGTAGRSAPSSWPRWSAWSWAATLGDRRGPRAALLAGVAIFAAGLLAGGLAEHMAVFVAARAVQGVGGGRHRGLALRRRRAGLRAGAAAAAVRRLLRRPGCCPRWSARSLAGLITTHARPGGWVFLGLLPLIALGLALVLPALRGLGVPERRGRAAARPPVVGAARRCRHRRAAVRRPAAGPRSPSASPSLGRGRAGRRPAPLLPARHRPGPAGPARRRRRPRPAGRRLLRHGRPAAPRPDRAARLQPDDRRASR